MTNIERLISEYDVDIGVPYFTNPDYDLAIIGISQDNRIIYDYNLMILSLMQTEHWTEEEAIEWIDYNVIRTIDYMGSNSPIIVYPLDDYRITYAEERIDYMNIVAKFEKVSYEQFKEDFMKAFPIVEKEKNNKTFVDIYEENLKRTYDSIKLPKRSTKGSAGYDFFIPMPILVAEDDAVVIPTGIRCKIEDGWLLKMYPRSGHGFKTGIHLANTVGIIDSDYYNANNEGHIQIKLVNDSALSQDTIKIEAGQAFCQGIFVPYGITEDDDANIDRTGGFGSTGN